MSTTLFLITALLVVIALILGTTGGMGLALMALIIALPVGLTGAIVKAIEKKKD